MKVESLWIRTAGADAIRLAVDVLRPSELSKGLPTVLIMTRYWRSFHMRLGFPADRAPEGPRAQIPARLVGDGFACVVADARGTGASEGEWAHPWSPAELSDYKDVVEWIVGQPWSNGRVGSLGISYEGSTAALLAASGHPAVRAVVPRSFEFDPFEDIAFPGGVYNSAFMRAWSTDNAMLDENRVPKEWGRLARLFLKGVRRTDEDARTGEALASIVAQRRNFSVSECMAGIQSRGDFYGPKEGGLAAVHGAPLVSPAAAGLSPAAAVTIDSFSVAARLPALRTHAVPMQVWGSWMDGTTARSALRMFASLPSVREVYLGAFNHTGESHASLGRFDKRPRPPLQEQWTTMIAFLDQRLRSAPAAASSDEDPAGAPSAASAAAEAVEPEAAVETPRCIHYYLMGAERWEKTTEWPLPGLQPVEFSLAQDHTLCAPDPAAVESTLDYVIDPQATTGDANRWFTQLARPVRYNDRGNPRKTGRLLQWLSAPLEADTRVVGEIELRLRVAVSSPKTAIFAYFELVETPKKVHYVTEGVLNVCFAGNAAGAGTVALEDERDDLPRRFSAAVYREPPAGELFDLTITMLPTAVLVKKGWRYRLSLAGTDRDAFPDLEIAPGASISVAAGGSQGSSLIVPSMI